MDQSDICQYIWFLLDFSKITFWWNIHNVYDFYDFLKITFWLNIHPFLIWRSYTHLAQLLQRTRINLSRNITLCICANFLSIKAVSQPTNFILEITKRSYNLEIYWYWEPSYLLYYSGKEIWGLGKKFEWTKVWVNKYFAQIIFLFSLMKILYD